MQCKGSESRTCLACVRNSRGPARLEGSERGRGCRDLNPEPCREAAGGFRAGESQDCELEVTEISPCSPPQSQPQQPCPHGPQGCGLLWPGGSGSGPPKWEMRVEYLPLCPWSSGSAPLVYLPPCLSITPGSESFVQASKFSRRSPCPAPCWDLREHGVRVRPGIEM